MGKARYCRTHAWAGFHYAGRKLSHDGQLAFWTRLTIGFWTIECLPRAASDRIEKILDLLWGDAPESAGSP